MKWLSIFIHANKSVWKTCPRAEWLPSVLSGGPWALAKITHGIFIKNIQDKNNKDISTLVTCLSIPTF
jgi:hypothetical protein